VFLGKPEEGGNISTENITTKFEISIHFYNCNVEILQVLSGEQSVPGRRQGQVKRRFE